MSRARSYTNFYNTIIFELLESCYRSVFEIACGKDIHSIAFPSISTGVYGYPKRLAAEIASMVMREFESDFDTIIACCFSEHDALIYRGLLCPDIC